MDDIKRQCLEYFYDDKVQAELKVFLDKIVGYIGRKIWPYILVACVMFVLVLVLLIITVLTLKFPQQKAVLNP